MSERTERSGSIFEVDTADGGARSDAIDHATQGSEASRVPEVLRINEVDCVTDGVEVINIGKEPVELSGYAVTDSLPDTTHRAGVVGTLAAGELVVIPTGFGISCAGEDVYLLHGTNVADMTSVPRAPSGASWGRLPDGRGEFAATLPTLGKANLAYEDLSAVLFRPFDEEAQIEISLSEESIAALAADHKTYVESTITITVDGQRVGPLLVGVRIKGSASVRDLSGKAAFKIDANRFVRTQRVLGIKGFTLNNQVQDQSTVREWLAYTVFAAVGVPTPRVGYARVTVNGDLYGSYLVIDGFGDDKYVERNFESTLAIFESNPGSDLLPDRLELFECDYGDEQNGRAMLTHVVEKLSMVNHDAYYSEMQEEIDFDEVLRELAADHLVLNRDGYHSNVNNYGLHLDGNGRLTLLPWGVDNAWSRPVVDLYRGNGILFGRCTRDVACMAAYDAALRDVLQSTKQLLTDGLIDKLRLLGSLNAVRYIGDRELDASIIGDEVEGIVARIEESVRNFESVLGDRVY